MITLRVLAAAALVGLVLTACGSSGGTGGTGGTGDSGGTDSAATACQKLIKDSEIAQITGVADLHFDPTGTAVDLPDARACPYQDATGYEAIVSVYTGPGYADAFTTQYTIMRQAPNPVAVPSLGKGAVWVENAYELDVDLGQEGLVVQFFFKNNSNEFDDRTGKAVRVATVVSGRI